jgi:hypothetical protein
LDHVPTTSTDGGAEETNSSPEKNSAKKVLSALSALGVYTRAYTFKQFTQPEASIPTHVFSLSESKVHTMHSDPSHGPALFEHNKKYMMRVFPKSTRINSSNVDPAFHWRQGAQMVALNWQRLDKGMMLNEGMFANTGGWVLKPEGFRTTRGVVASESGDMDTKQQPRKRSLDLVISLLAAQNLPLPPEKESSHAAKIKPYVKMQMHVDTHGPPGQGKPDSVEDGAEDTDAAAYKRKSATYRTDSPDFGGERITWQKIPDVVDSLSFLRYVTLLL